MLVEKLSTYRTLGATITAGGVSKPYLCSSNHVDSDKVFLFYICVHDIKFRKYRLSCKTLAGAFLAAWVGFYPWCSGEEGGGIDIIDIT